VTPLHHRKVPVLAFKAVKLPGPIDPTYTAPFATAGEEVPLAVHSSTIPGTVETLRVFS
jgi:hypothetical protein